ncbi:Transposase (plasmid) [Nostoc flagelliforme CCNUN1]|uniref:Transposase n=1 Tax=Nostoc flagelliforme CCNUN1 TaxID=2038116 RepID=A0A2K8T6Y3_9NOSO|nr:Transposase [Nostoc flagelliforme CCNUN1]
MQVNPLVCLGDGHDGVWNLVKEFGTEKFERLKILDWYHLKENLYKIGGSLKCLKAAESLLWQGRIEPIQALFNNCRGKQVKKFIAYLEKHRTRIINYSYYQGEQLCSIGSGSVESAIKQIGARIKISGAQWNLESVNQILSERLSLSKWFACYLSLYAKTGCSPLASIGAFKLQTYGGRWNDYTRLCGPAKLPWQTTNVSTVPAQ